MGVHIVGTGDIGARRLIGLDQAGIHRVGHRSNQHGNLTGLGGDALGSAGADCQYQVTVIAYKPLADSEQCGGITLSILIVDLNSLSIHIAMVCQGVHKSLPG